jgi:hypothetical protein
MLRFYLPVIEPDRRISRIRLSDKIAHATGTGFDRVANVNPEPFSS